MERSTGGSPEKGKSNEKENSYRVPLQKQNNNNNNNNITTTTTTTTTTKHLSRSLFRQIATRSADIVPLLLALAHLAIFTNALKMIQ